MSEYNNRVDKKRITEIRTRNLERPYEYFKAQVWFAYKWSELTGTSLMDALILNTAVYRRVTGAVFKKGQLLDHRWVSIIDRLKNSVSPETTSRIIFDTYIIQDHAQYTPSRYPENDGKHFGFFSFDYYPKHKFNHGKNTIKIHFISTQRGEKSGLHPDFLNQRRADLHRMFQHIRVAHPDAEEVMGRSWLYIVPQYRDTFPKEYTEGMSRLVPLEYIDKFPGSVGNISFMGDSLWGQFVDRKGDSRVRTYQEFIPLVEEARTPTDLLNAFPYKPYLAKSSVGILYKDLDI